MFGNHHAAIVRTLSLFFIVWALCGPIDSSFIAFKAYFLPQTAGTSPVLFWILKTILVIISFALLRSPSNIFLSGVQFVCGTMFLHSGVISSSLWNYNSHIIIISLLAFITGLRTKDENADSDLITALSLVFATIYFQAAISKLVVSGMDWMNSGLSIYMHMLKFNPRLSSLIDGNIVLYQIAAWMTVAGELILGALFVFPKTRRLAALISITFHIMLWCTFHISFWHLWIFYPAVYCLDLIHVPKFRFVLKHLYKLFLTKTASRV